MGKKGLEENRDLLTILRNIIFIIAIYLYFMGWIYAYNFFEAFGVSFYSLEIPFYYFFVYSFFVFSYWKAAIITIVTLVLIYLLVYYFPSKSLQKWMLALILIILFPLFSELSQKRALDKAIEKRDREARPIQFTFRNEAGLQYAQDLKEANSAGELRLLAESSDRFYVFHQPRDEENPEPILPLAHIYQIFKNDILSSNITLENKLTRGEGE